MARSLGLAVPAGASLAIALPHATPGFIDPHSHSDFPLLDEGRHTGAHPGVVIDGPGKRSPAAAR